MARFIVLLVFAASCATSPLILVPRGAQAVSLLGDTLWSVPVPVDEGANRVRLLHDARLRVNARPGSFEPMLELAYRTSGVGRLREAVALYTDAGYLGITDARVYVRRGELYLRLRYLGGAVSDLRLANRLLLQGNQVDLFLEPNGQMRAVHMPFTSNLLLGAAYLARGEWPRAREALVEARRQARAPADTLAAERWLALVAVRSGRPDEITTELPRDLWELEAGMVRLMRGDTAGAVDRFEHVRRNVHWSSLAHLIAEAELARLPVQAGVAAESR
jgi:hypothetical protein